MTGLPIAFTYGHCVFGRRRGDAWALFALPTRSYAGLSREGRRDVFLALLGAVEAAQADLQIIRVSRAWDIPGYARHALAQDVACHRRARRAYVDAQSRRLLAARPSEPRVFMAVSLSPPRRDIAEYVSSAVARTPREWFDELARLLRPGDRPGLSMAELERVRRCAGEACERLSAAWPGTRPATVPELQWLIRRGFCRGRGEPEVDGLDEPRALLFECNGTAMLAPLEGEVLRWCNAVVEHRARCLRIEGEGGVSWQAHLVAGALPERVAFPDARLELMFAPPESLPFGIDLSLNARYLPNELAVRIARRRIQDADQVMRAESDGDQGVSDQGLDRTRQARELLSYLQSASRPPLLRATLAVAVGARDERELEERVGACRRAFGEVRLHRPLGDQLPLFCQHLPGQRVAVHGYDDTLTPEQVAAMMPLAVHAVGSRRGFLLGHTLSGSRRPVRFNLREGSDRNRNAAILSVGALGTGKTTLDQKLVYEAFLQGARIVDCDPKGDHRVHLLPEVAPHAEVIPLRPDPALRGMLDPLRVAPPHLRQEATVSFLLELLPARADAAWETAVVRAVDRVLRRARRPACGAVIAALREAGDGDVADTLDVYASGGLTQLGFGEAERPPPPVGRAQLTYLPIRDLPGPDPDTPRTHYSQAERIGEQLVRLIAMFATQLMSSERERLKVFSFDEGWRLLRDPVGRTLLASLQRMGRSELAVPIISTQLVTDALVGQRESLDNLIGATFAFGMRSEAEAARALQLLGLDADDRVQRRRLLELDRGRCLMRDHAGRVEAVQIDVVLPRLLRAFSTTPSRRREDEDPAPCA